MDGLPNYYCDIVEDCIERNMTKDEAMTYVKNEYSIPLQDTNRVWNHLERTNPDLFIAYNARIPPRGAKPSPPEVTSARRRIRRGTAPPPPPCRPLLPDLNVAVASPQKAAAYASTQAGPSRAANANANQNLQATQQQPDDFWQRVMNTLAQIQCDIQHLDTLGQIQSNTEQMVKLLTDGHGFGTHAGSLKRQRSEEAEERGKNEADEKQQKKNERGDGEGLQENEGGDNE